MSQRYVPPWTELASGDPSLGTVPLPSGHAFETHRAHEEEEGRRREGLIGIGRESSVAIRADLRLRMRALLVGYL